MNTPKELSEMQLVFTLGVVVFGIYAWSAVLWLVRYVDSKKKKRDD